LIEEVLQFSKKVKIAMPPKRSLTRLQKRLVADLDKIMSAAGLDYWNVLDRNPQYDRVGRTLLLQGMIRQIVRGEVVSQYTLVDEHLSCIICRYMFQNKQFPTLWKTKKFERFNYYVLEKMSLMEKLAFVKDVSAVPKGIAADIESINAIRNALAHAFFPENLRAYRSKPGWTGRQFVGPRYKGVAIFTLDGLERFLADARRVVQLLTTRWRDALVPARLE
jgi:hypothetical protein